MKKRMKRILALVLSATMLFGVTACGSDKGKVKGKKKVTFWATVDVDTQDTYLKIVDDFNASQSEITVQFVPQTSGFASSLGTSLRGTSTPDVVVVPQESFKNYVNEGLLECLDEYVENDDNENFSLDDFWPNAKEMYSYNPETGESHTGKDFYAITEGNSSQTIVYNVDLFGEQQINLVSVPEDELEDYNSKNGTKLLPHGYYVYDTAPAEGMVARSDGKYHVFNNRIPMNWTELVELSKIFTKTYNSSSTSTYGYLTEYWFQNAWSVGGDCIQWDEEKGQNVFTLGDDSPNYLVTGSDGVEINGNKYSEGEVLAWADRNYVEANASDKKIAGYLDSQKLYKLPSTRDAFAEFLRWSQDKEKLVTSDKYGYGISPKPTALGNDSMQAFFTTGEVAMLASGTPTYFKVGQDMDTLGKNWDIAPIYQYREYNDDGTPKTVNGTKVYGTRDTVNGGSGYAIPSNSSNKEAAWKFISYVTGLDGQRELMKLNRSIPNQKSLAYSDEYLNETSNYAPKSKIVGVEATECGREADWAYLDNMEWILNWSDVLNTKVREGVMTLEEFFEDPNVQSTDETLKKYDVKHIVR